MFTIEGWNALWQGFDKSLPAHEFEMLAMRYAEPHRHYHTSQHIAECLAHFVAARALCEHSAEVELALWFHDAIYEPRTNDNEQQSADWALRVMSEAGIDAAARERVPTLIMATCHNVLPKTQDAQVLVDIDLAILGADAPRFDEYENQVRAEYSWVPAFLFRRTRKKILREFLARPAIYSTAHFNRQLEKKARENLARSLLKLDAV